ncbi:hypothetical protein [Rhizobium hidalgonense]|uniref:hypothetical protein n=1 Tax=Rhizobium hidalgonense TaxID=1538159 RepID=UPI0028710725|nr:hypothetical protein [Rhizobium hidalgonense]MDR9808223.1 hypothetical protein [Rhizobium hidalgonense]
MTEFEKNLNPMEVIHRARQAVPAVDYALALAGIAAAGSLVVGFIGYSQASVILFGLLFIGMVLVFVFSRLIVSKSRSIQTAGLSLMWLVLAFFAFFMFFTVTAVATGWPCNWADVLKVKNSCNPPVLIKGMAPADAAKIFERQAKEFSHALSSADRKFFPIEYEFTKSGVIEGNEGVGVFLGGVGDQEKAEKRIKQAETDLKTIEGSFSAAHEQLVEALKESKIDAAKEAEIDASAQIKRFFGWCSEGAGIETAFNGFRVLLPLESWPECQQSFRYGLE